MEMLIRLTAMLKTALALSLTIAPLAWAQEGWPSKPVRVIVAGGAGSGTDITARIFTEPLAKAFGQAFVVDNKAGANGLIATEALIKSPNDGHTILFTYAAAHVINPLVMDKVPYNVQKDFSPVAQIGSGGNLLVVHPSLPVKNLREFLAYIKAKPANELAYGSWGDGSGGHLTMEALLHKAGGLKVRHVPYKTTPAMLTDILGGHIPMGFTAIANGIPLVTSGKLRAIAVSGPNRVIQLPDVPTMTEQGIPFEMADQVSKIGFANFPANTPAQFSQVIERDTREWGVIVRAAGIKAP